MRIALNYGQATYLKGKRGWIRLHEKGFTTEATLARLSLTSS